MLDDHGRTERGRLIHDYARRTGRPILRVIRRVNLPRALARQMFGNEHPLLYRIAIGTGIAVGGAYIAHIKCEGALAAFSMEFVGWSLHGIGLTPHIEELIALATTE